MNPRTRHQVGIPILLVSLFFLSACSGGEKKTSKDNAETKPKITTSTTSDTTSSQSDSTALTTNGETRGGMTPVDTIATKPLTPIPTGGNLPGRAFDEERLSVVLDLIAQDLEAQKLAYVSSLGQDCSGIYHKIKDQVQKKMSILGDDSRYTYPAFNQVRSSRQIADWYYRNGNLHIVQDAMADRNLIRPGAVMFYGRTEEKYNNLTIEKLTNPGKFVHDGTNGKIMHVATVTKVIRDEDGNVINYTIMHGRNSKYTASRTSGNHEGPGYDKVFTKFPFGNWNQQWVAVAQIETPKQ